MSDFLAELAEKCKPTYFHQWVKVPKEGLRRFVIEVKLMRSILGKVRKTVTEALETAPKQSDYGSIHDYNREAAEHWRIAMIVAQTQLEMLPEKKIEGDIDATGE